MLTGFKNAVEVDFTLEENKKKIEEAFKQAHAEAGAVYPLIIGGKKVETEKKIAAVQSLHFVFQAVLSAARYTHLSG